MLWSGVITLLLFVVGLTLFMTASSALASITSPLLWVFALVLLFGVISGNIYGIVLPTMITSLVSEDGRDKANGMYGTVGGISFAITSIGSGVTLAYAGMFWVLVIAIILTVGALIHLTRVSFSEPALAHEENGKQNTIDITGTIQAIQSIPGLFALIFFTTFNNFLGGVFMALMDAYGLSLVSVQVWGLIWGFLSLGFILGGGLIIAKRGLGEHPLKTLFSINIIIWIVCMFFTIQPSILLLVVGIFI